MADHRLFAAGDEGLPGSIPRFLFAILGAPVVWALHLAASYFLITLDCITPWDGGTWSVLAVTALSAGVSAGAGWVAWRMWRGLGTGVFHPSEREWRRFLLQAGMAASVLFTLITIATGLAPLFVDTCA